MVETARPKKPSGALSISHDLISKAPNHGAKPNTESVNADDTVVFVDSEDEAIED